MTVGRAGGLPGAMTVALVVCAAVGLGFLRDVIFPAPPSGTLARYPELAGVRSPAPIVGRRITVRRPGAESLLAAIQRDVVAKDGALSVVRGWLERDNGRPPPIRILSDPRADAVALADAWALRECADPTADAVLLRVARDRALHLTTRVRAFVALCRPGNAAAVETLADVVLDVQEEEDLRVQALVRMSRFASPLPRRTRAMLDVPFGGLDRLAAAALGATGDPESPSLVLRLLRETFLDGATHWAGAPHAQLAAEAIRRMAGDDSTVHSALAEAGPFLTDPGIEYESWRDPVPPELERLARAFEAWVAAYPEALETNWERLHRRHAAAASAAAQRFRSVEDIEAAEDASIDAVAAALALAGHDADTVQDVLLDLDRVADWLRPQIPAGTTPEVALTTMQRSLTAGPRFAYAGEDRSDPRCVLRTRTGNCLGWTLVFVALGDRLGLPLRAVSVPEHVFVRWEDGATRINWDPVNDGASWTDDEIVRRFGRGQPRESVLRDLTRRALVSYALSNTVKFRLETTPWNSDAAARLARTAERIDPDNLHAAMNLAASLAFAGADRDPELSETARRAEAVRGFAPRNADWLARCLADRDFCDEALALLDRHPEAGADAATRRWVRAHALCRAGRHAAAHELIDGLLAEAPMDGDVLVLDITCAFASSTERGWHTLDAVLRRLPERSTPQWDIPPAQQLLVGVATRLLADKPRTDERARVALDLMDAMDRDTDRPPGRAARALGSKIGSDGQLSREVERLRAGIRERAWDRLGDAAKAAEFRAAARRWEIR